MPQLELLSPARDALTAIAAINHGADAVYMGAARFGARQQAGNSLEEIKQVVDYAHIFGAKVYVAVNTIFYDNERTVVENLIFDLWKLGVDAIIIQDTGILEMELPPMRFHMSTQANNRTLEQIVFWEKTGLSRVILARELSLAQISDIGKKTSIELEAFVHGALCVSYSGNCYMSCDINNRSANRGNCAQPCRLPYDLVDGAGKTVQQNKHLLSLGDLDASSVLENLIDAGITSFKIEGRLKDSVYVKNITAHYHGLLNRFVAANPGYQRASKGLCSIGFEPDPARSFNRGTSVYFYHGRTTGLVNTNTPKSLGKWVGTVKETGKDWFALESNETLANGDGICFQHNEQLLGTQINGKTATGYKPQSMDGIFRGTELYRNRDHEFIKQVEKSDTPRKLPVKVSVCFNTPEIQILAVSGSEHSSLQVDFGTETAQNQERAAANWKTQLSKTGDTCFDVAGVELQGDILPHLPVSKINEIRRILLDKLQEQLQTKHIESRTVSEIRNVSYHSSILNYQHNVANRLARNFYSKRGVSDIGQAFELEKPANKEYTVMTTRYCVLFELGKCKKLIPKEQQLAEPLFLLHRERKYRLEFDCKECQMLVKSTQS